MSKENVKKFLEEIGRNEELEKKFKIMMNDGQACQTKIVELANTAGFNCTKGDFQTMIDENGELTDSDLKTVAGGGLQDDFTRRLINIIVDLFQRR